MTWPRLQCLLVNWIQKNYFHVSEEYRLVEHVEIDRFSLRMYTSGNIKDIMVYLYEREEFDSDNGEYFQIVCISLNDEKTAIRQEYTKILKKIKNLLGDTR